MRAVLLPLGRRLLGALATLLGVLLLVFLAVRVAPGDPVENILGEFAEARDVELLRARLRLDEPLHRQLALFLGDVADGSLGTSYSELGAPRSVISRIAEVFPATAELAGAALALAILISFPLGLAAALRRNTWVDHGASVLAMLGVALPVIWLGPALIYLFSVRVKLFPVPGGAITGPSHLILPALVLGTALSGKLTRILRASLLDTLGQGAALAARACGVQERRVILGHVLRASLIPVVTVLGMQLAALLGGAILTERIFSRPGVGSLLLDAVARRDYDLVQGTVIVIAGVYVLVNLIVDLVYLLIDPRIRHAS
jgi:ABC-type dipeptide/oligopeptide/nickel transport system permease component